MNEKNQKGLSLIGVIVSIFIVASGLVAVLTLASFSLSNVALAEKRLIASGLAQEGIEIVRDVRRGNVEWIDWNWYGNNGAISTSTSQNFRVQYNNTGLLSFSETPLRIDSNDYYQYSSGNNTEFYRRINLTKVSYRQVKVVVEVKWEFKGNWYYLTAEDHLWNWK